jgi:hypothetical protein
MRTGKGNSGLYKKNAALYYKKNAALQERAARQHRAPSMRDPNTLPKKRKKDNRRHGLKTKTRRKLTYACQAISAACGA